MLSLLLWVPSADACSCAIPSPARSVAFSDSFPVDGAIPIFLRGPWPEALRHQEAASYRLQGPDGVVPLEPRVEGTAVFLEPTRLLPDTTYTLERATFYRGDRPLSDGQARALFEAEPLERRWEPAGSLHTAATPAETVRAPLRVSFNEAVYWTLSPGNSCGPGEGVRGWISVEGNLHETDMLSIEVKGQGARWWAPADARHFRFSDQYCAPNPIHTDVTQAPQVRLRVTDAAGRTRLLSPWTTASLHTDPYDSDQHPDNEHAARLVAHAERERLRFSALGDVPITDKPAYAGPPVCTEAETRALGGFVWPQQAQNVFFPTPWEPVLVSGGGGAALVLRDIDGEPLEMPPLSDRAKVVAGEGVVLSWDGASDVITIAAREPDGRARWSHRLHTFGREPRIRFSAVGGGRVLLGWSWWGIGLSREEQWTLLDLDTGAVVAQGSLRELSPEGRHVRGAAWDGTRFVLSWAWSAPGRIRREQGTQPASAVAPGEYLSFLGQDGTWGTTSSMPAEMGRVQGLFPTSDGLYVVGVDGPDLLVGQLGAEGALLAEPVVVNPGVAAGGWVSVLPWGERLAIAWQADESWVTTIEEGRAARPQPLGAGQRALRPNLVAQGGDLVVLYGAHSDGAWRAVRSVLACD